MSSDFSTHGWHMDFAASRTQQSVTFIAMINGINEKNIPQEKPLDFLHNHF